MMMTDGEGVRMEPGEKKEEQCQGTPVQVHRWLEKPNSIGRELYAQQQYWHGAGHIARVHKFEEHTVYQVMRYRDRAWLTGQVVEHGRQTHCLKLPLCRWERGVAKYAEALAKDRQFYSDSWLYVAGQGTTGS